MSAVRPSIVVGVTSPMSLMLMRGLPERLASEGWEVTVVSSPGPELEALRRSGVVNVHSVAMAREPSVLADAKALLAWWRMLRQVRPSVILVGTPKAGMLGVVAGLLTRVPVRIYHLRGLRLETSSGVSRLVFRAVESLTLAAATSTVAVSRSLKQRVADLRLGRGSKVVVLGLGSSNGVDIDRFQPGTSETGASAARQGLGLTLDTPVIGYVGRIHPDKGLDTLLAASRLLSTRQVRHQLLVVGGIDHPTAGELVRRFQDLEADVILPGAVRDAAPYYQAMSVHCLPTLREGFPNAVLEASASGIATVTTDATGAVDSVVSGETGYVVPLGDGTALADALEHALADQEDLTRRARNAREWVVSNYSRERVQGHLVGFLRQALESAVVR